MDNQEVERLLYEVDEEGEGLTSREIEFIADLIDQLDKKRIQVGNITISQRAWISYIHEKKVR